VLVLQCYWIANYYQVNKATFEKEVNLALEDAVKKEFDVRCDTVQTHIYDLLMDTTRFSLTCTYDTKKKTTMCRVADAHVPKDKFEFHSDSLDVQGQESNLAFRQKLARFLAKEIRNDDLSEHFVMFKTQRLGNFIESQTRRYDFDTARLRPIFKQSLLQRDIKVPFSFLLRVKDSTLNKTHLDPQILARYPVVSKALITFKMSAKDHYVRAMFSKPSSYIISKMGLLFGGSIILILMVSLSMFYLLRTLFREKKLSAVKNDFISNITHEFKTPIATVSAAVEALTSFDALEDREKTTRYLNHSKNELKRLSDLVNKVLNISLYENQQFDIKPEPLNVDETVNAILSEAALGNSKAVHYTYTNNSGISVLHADKLYFQHTIINVIDNAIKYAGEDVGIEVECTQRQGCLVIAVKDNGLGIHTENLPFVFEKFYRVPNASHHIKGHGLGLSYVKSIIEKHRGWCKMESEFGKGSTLYLAWPI